MFRKFLLQLSTESDLIEDYQKDNAIRSPSNPLFNTNQKLIHDKSKTEKEI